MCYKNKYVFYLHFKTQLKSWKQIILLMIPNGEGWYYFDLEKLSALLRAITSKHVGDCY